MSDDCSFVHVQKQGRPVLGRILHCSIEPLKISRSLAVRGHLRVQKWPRLVEPKTVPPIQNQIAPNPFLRPQKWPRKNGPKNGPKNCQKFMKKEIVPKLARLLLPNGNRHIFSRRQHANSGTPPPSKAGQPFPLLSRCTRNKQSQTCPNLLWSFCRDVKQGLL